MIIYKNTEQKGNNLQKNVNNCLQNVPEFTKFAEFTEYFIIFTAKS